MIRGVPIIIDIKDGSRKTKFSQYTGIVHPVTIALKHYITWLVQSIKGSLRLRES